MRGRPLGPLERSINSLVAAILLRLPYGDCRPSSTQIHTFMVLGNSSRAEEENVNAKKAGIETEH